MREYLDYIEEHYDNVQKAWQIVQEKCNDMKFINDDFNFYVLDNDIKNHDISKLDKEEFQYYRQYFFPTEKEEFVANSCYGVKSKDYFKNDFDKAWKSHKASNNHHWQTWTKINYYYPDQPVLYCVHMVVDWIAMSMKFGGTARDYYEKNKDEIELQDWAIELIYEIFDRVYGKESAV